MSPGPDYPAKLRELHSLIATDVNAIPGLWRGIPVSGRMRNCFGHKSGCGSPYCPACSQSSHFKLEQMLKQAVDAIDPSRLWFATFTAADCSDDALRFTVKQVSDAGRKMLKGVKSLNGWFMRQEVSRYGPGRYHAHIHALIDTKPGYHSGRNSMSAMKWEEAWSSALPSDMHSVQFAPVVIKRVTATKGIIRYLSKSPWSEAIGESTEETIDSVVEICNQLLLTTGLKRYASSSSLSIKMRPSRRQLSAGHTPSQR